MLYKCQQKWAVDSSYIRVSKNILQVFLEFPLTSQGSVEPWWDFKCYFKRAHVLGNLEHHSKNNQDKFHWWV